MQGGKERPGWVPPTPRHKSFPVFIPAYVNKMATIVWLAAVLPITGEREGGGREGTNVAFQVLIW